MHWCQVDCGVCVYDEGPDGVCLEPAKQNVRCSPRHAECDTDRDRTVAECSRICTENFVRINEQTLGMFYALPTLGQRRLANFARTYFVRL
jgi:hypothetical protein